VVMSPCAKAAAAASHARRPALVADALPMEQPVVRTLLSHG
jgi:hypothetical protein